MVVGEGPGKGEEQGGKVLAYNPLSSSQSLGREVWGGGQHFTGEEMKPGKAVTCSGSHCWRVGKAGFERQAVWGQALLCSWHQPVFERGASSVPTACEEAQVYQQGVRTEHLRSAAMEDTHPTCLPQTVHLPHPCPWVATHSWEERTHSHAPGSL